MIAIPQMFLWVSIWVNNDSVSCKIKPGLVTTSQLFQRKKRPAAIPNPLKLMAPKMKI